MHRRLVVFGLLLILTLVVAGLFAGLSTDSGRRFPMEWTVPAGSASTTGVPETFMIDQNGVIVDKFIGAVPEEWMLNHILRLLHREPQSP